MRKPSKHPVRHGMEWTLALLLPVVLWWAVGTYAGEFYRVRVSQLSGDYEQGTILWVDKWHTGARLPFRTWHFTYLHLGDGRATKPYRRKSELNLSRNDLVVFNHVFPDSVAPDARLRTMNRVIGLPGDTIRMYHGKLFINGKSTDAAPGTLVNFEAQLTDSTDLEELESKYGLKEAAWVRPNKFRFMAHPLAAIRLAGDSLVMHFSRLTEARPDPAVFPTGYKDQNGDNYGPVVVPYKGMVIDSLTQSLFAERLWNKYEMQGFVPRDPVDSAHVFAHDYYFVLSDYRSMGNDSRYFGPIPEYLIIGKAVKAVYTPKSTIK